ncbi:cd7 antigen-like [Cheilinus undulatus]|uniref:cd7 antigen-like n=1 Tax=Cheilinus undulatus TaxID=241271 RepID=UPI001BD3DB02|nr:cd7 antigen-like [Cheilinus undulatus]
MTGQLNPRLMRMLEMRGIQYLVCLWTLLYTLTGCAHSDPKFLERNEGESVVFPCVVEKKVTPPYGVYLKRSWLHPSEVLFMYKESEFTVTNLKDKNRTSVSGDPSSHSLNVTISELRPDDTDRYFCEFVVERPHSDDLRVMGDEEFFLMVHADATGSMDINLIETTAGGSAVLPCLPPRGEALAVVGVSLKQQRGQQPPVEVWHHSKYHHGKSPPPSSPQFPDERVQLSFATNSGSIIYSVTMLQLQPEDSAIYSCTLLLQGLPDSSTRLGRQAFFVSVKGECGCSSYSSLLYVLSAAVAVLFFFLLIGCVVFHRGRARRSVKSHPQVPIYEDMAGVQADVRKLAPYHLEEIDSSEYKNCSMKRSCPENYYERPSGGPRKASP